MYLHSSMDYKIFLHLEGQDARAAPTPIFSMMEGIRRKKTTKI